jgi:hypothetical protein
MTRREFLPTAIIATSLVSLSRSVAADSNSSTLEVHITYTGSGTVDDSHKLNVALWDTPDFVKPGGNPTMPIGSAQVTSKSGTATFKDIQKNPVFVSMGYDPTGKWDQQSDPPAGTSLGVYGKEPGVPDPIKLVPGMTTKISATLDDSYKKP